ncbi:hypothetical protein [Streptomyces yaizuensis]|uniref:Uncharacterized protein n=1 Tax=Streptomyces yaizuensis TaxID=2989713 RepID=A0ABQ5NUB2_9ACTN|nr:hypothetical protein [Streptomyces sp. YSPA8]GLF93957.1 hypothetical protein SYYSPA8_06690 [Streptomyces sp. YSPA8]
MVENGNDTQSAPAHGELDGTAAPAARGNGRWSRRGLTVPLCLTAGAVALAVGAVLALRDDGSAGADAADEPVSASPVVCAQVIARGTVTRTEPQGDRTRVVLAVDRYLKPSKGPKETVFTVPRAEAGFFASGERMLVTIPRSPDEPVQSYTGAEVAFAWERMAAELPAAGEQRCERSG